jgi:hypothetical protein
MRARSGVVAGIGLLLLGCTSSGSEQPAAEPSDEVMPPSDEVMPPGDEVMPPGDEEFDTRACSDDVVDAIDVTIAGQLEAFAADDFDAALEFAARSFRAGVDAADFRALILEAYPTLTKDATHRSSACLLTAPGAAEVRIEVTGEDGTRDDHVYRMVDEEGRWLVEGAVTLDGSGRTLA